MERKFMELAYEEAVQAGLRQEVPIGAVLVDADGLVLAQDGNRTIELSDPSAHAEILVLRAGGLSSQNYRLTGATLFVTLEPCLMCMGALIHARLAHVVFAALDPKAGAAVSRYQIGQDQRLNHSLIVSQGPMASQCGELLRNFFKAKRQATLACSNRPSETKKRQSLLALPFKEE
ncbi:MAG: tRNA adenosine(34) deaminase TadA [Desulfobulbaceae bacterium]|nr:tRNA adenosine(34) deaminase TadA [Desulfobulbaceae bacterium]